MNRIAALALAVVGLLGTAGAAQEKTTAYVAYLGVTTAPVGETLGAHLKLPPGVGLLVEYVDPASPAAKALARNDVLHKLGDQLLVNHDQLRALLHSYKPGETVTLTVIRNGESRKVEVQLGERAEPACPDFGVSALREVSGEIAKAVQIVISSVGSNVVKVLPQVSVMAGSNVSAVVSSLVTTTSSTANVQSSSQVAVKTNERGTFTLTRAGDQKTFTAISKDGTVWFNGPVDTDDQREKLSADLRKELEELEKILASPKGK